VKFSSVVTIQILVLNAIPSFYAKRAVKAYFPLPSKFEMYAGTLLNPFLMNVIEIQNDTTAKHALNRVVQKLSGLLGVDFNEVMNELTQYEEQ
jgi:hypothetical protein